MPKTIARFSVFLFLLSSILNGSLINDLRDKIRASAPFTAEFRQEMSAEDDVELVENGFFLYVSTDRMKWEYRSPEEKIFILYDGRISFYSPLENQLTVGDVSKQKSQWLWQILLHDQADVQVTEDMEGQSISFRQELDEMQLTVFLGRNGLPARAVQLDSLGYRHQFMFSRYRVHCRVGPDEFKLNLPQDVDIIEME